MKLTPRIASMSGTSGARRGHSPRKLVAALCASVALLLGVAAPVATAATPIDSYGYLASFGGTAIPTAGQSNAVAVDGSTGNIFVAQSLDSEEGPYFFANDVRIYSADSAAGGVPLTRLDVGSVPGTAQGYILPLGVAVDQSDGSLYIADAAGQTAYRFLSDGAPVATYTFDPSFVTPPIGGGINGIAVDPTTRDVLVGDSQAHRVFRFDQTGALVSSFNGSDTTAGAFTTGPQALAVGPTGTTYVADPQSGRVERFSAAGASLGRLTIPNGGVPSSIAVNPQSGEVAVVATHNGLTFLEGFNAADQPIFSSRIPSQLLSQGLTGLAWDSGTDRIYLDTENGTVHTFVPALQPGVDPPLVSQITTTGAHFEAEVAPGGAKTDARFEYCPASAACANYPVSNPEDPSNPWVRLADHKELEGFGEETIEDDLTGLTPNTRYLVRISANRVSADNVATENTSATTTLETPLAPPVVQTGGAGAVTDTQAELTGTIATYGAQTTYHFEYGPTASYGAGAPAGAEGAAGSERLPRSFARVVAGLQPGTEYHFRLVAHNAAGTTNGADRTFTTQSADQIPPARGYEQVSPPNKRGAALTTWGFQVSADGSGFEYMAFQAGSDAEGAPIYTRYLSRRGPSGWGDWQPLDPPQNITRGLMESTVQAVSPDFTHALVASNHALTPGAIEQGGNLYLVDLRTGAYTLVGAASGLQAYASMAGTQNENMYMQGAPDFSWVVFNSVPPLLPGVAGKALYKWTESGGLEVLSRLPGPNGGSLPSSSISMPFGRGGKLTLREVSDDGNTVAFALGEIGGSGEFIPGGPDAGIYRRENGQTTAISVSQIPGDPATPVAGEIDGMSRDGRYVIFRSGRLTPDAPSVPSSGQWSDLYQYDAVTGDLTFIATANGFGQLQVFGVSDDGQTVYFEYIDHVALGLSDLRVWRDGSVQTITSELPNREPQAFASPNGRFLLYSGSGGAGYLYDAETEELACVSCLPDGTPAAAGLTIGARNIANRFSQVVLDDGTAFFDTRARLLTADHNGTSDVYSYKAGHLSLISPGDAPFDARFADATPDGSSVFFTTNEGIVGQDADGFRDVYVSRIGGGFASQSPPAPPASCLRSECGEADDGPLSSPPFSSSQSEPPAKPKKHCPKGTHARKVKGKTRCVKPSKAKKKANRANTNRRQGR